MKKKILSLLLVVALGATAIIGGTLAYFTDTDAQENVFVTGNVQIDLFEDFGDNDGIEKLLPATGSAQKGTLKNGIEKEVYVENTGSEKAYVRVQIAIPAILDDGDPTFNAANNVLHFNYDTKSVEDGKWNWSKTAGGTTGSDWNTYAMYIGENKNSEQIAYNVYVVTYETALEKGDVTVDAMSQVYLDSKVTNADIAKINETLDDEWKIYVVAEAGQADGFEDAYTALNTQFGVPGTYFPVFTAESEGKLWVDDEGMTAEQIKNTISVYGGLNGVDRVVEGNHVTYTAEGLTVNKATNPAGVSAYWVGTLKFTAPSDIDTTNAKFTRNGEEKSWAECKDGNNYMLAYVSANPADKDCHQTWTFDWDGDGVYEAVYSLDVTNITFVEAAK